MKARLVTKGYAQTYGVDYSDTFSLVANLTYVLLFISLAVSYDWDLSLTSGMPFYMVIFKKRFTWSNL